jgi:hypothetical protein
MSPFDTLETGKLTMEPPSTFTFTIWVPYIEHYISGTHIVQQKCTHICHTTGGLNGSIFYSAIYIPIKNASTVLLSPLLVDMTNKNKLIPTGKVFMTR